MSEFIEVTVETLENGKEKRLINLDYIDSVFPKIAVSSKKNEGSIISFHVADAHGEMIIHVEESYKMIRLMIHNCSKLITATHAELLMKNLLENMPTMSYYDKSVLGDV